MKEIILSFVFASISFCLFGQGNTTAKDGDMLILLRKDTPNQGKISINQDPQIERVFNLDILQSARQPGMQGFRIRIYFDLGQKSRKQSEDVAVGFMTNYPGIAVYRSYVSPYYKVSVGDFRTKDNALKLYYQLLKEYPKAFIIPEWVNFPPLE